MQTDYIFKKRTWSGIKKKDSLKEKNVKKAITMAKWLAINSNTGQPPLQENGVQLVQELIVTDF